MNRRMLKENVKRYWELRRKRRWLVSVDGKFVQITENQRILLSYLYFYGPASYGVLATILGNIGRRRSKKRVIDSLERAGYVKVVNGQYSITDKGRDVIDQIHEKNKWLSKEFVKLELENIVKGNVVATVGGLGEVWIGGCLECP